MCDLRSENKRKRKGPVRKISVELIDQEGSR